MMLTSRFASLTDYFQTEKFSAKHMVLIGACLLGLIVSCIDRSNALGWITISITYLLLLDRKIFQHTPLFFAILASLTAHHLISIINAYDVLTLFKQIDANGFHRVASKITAGESHNQFKRIGSGTYPTIISYFYHLQHSLLFSQSINIIAFVLANMVLVRFLAWLRINIQYSFWIILLFGFLPNQLILGAALLREPWQLLFLMSALYFGMQWHQARTIVSSKLLFFLIAAVCLSILHKVFFIYLVGLFGLLCLYNLAKHKNIFQFLVKSFISIVFLSWLGIFLFQNFVGLGQQQELAKIFLDHFFTSNNNPHQIDSFFAVIQDGSLSYRGSIGRREANSSYGNLGLVASYFHYQFGPPLKMIFQKNIEFFGKMLISYGYYFIIKMLCLFAIIACFKQRNIRLEWVTLLLAYLGINILWSIGTENYGTAMRHLMISDWIILMIGVPTGIFYMKRCTDFFRRRFKKSSYAESASTPTFE